MLKRILLIVLMLFPTFIGVVVGQDTLQYQNVEKLIDIIKNPDLQKTKPKRIFQAINRLKKLKDPKAIDSLVEVIAFRKIFPEEINSTNAIIGSATHAIPVFDRYPATSALAAIGQPALPALIKIIEKHGNHSVEGGNALATIITILHSKVKTIDYLKESATHSSTPEEAHELLAAAEDLNTILTNLRNAGFTDEDKDCECKDNQR